MIKIKKVMKQIKIVMYRNGIAINEEIYYINNMDFFIEDSIEEYVQSLRNMYIANGIGNIAFSLEIADIFVVNNYDLVKHLKGKTKYNKEQKEKLEKHRKKLEKVMRKWYL